MATDVVLALPWRSHPSRTRAFEQVDSYYRQLGYIPTLHDSGHDPFNRAASRNLAMRDADVVVVSDADTYVEAGPLEQAIRAARTSGRVHLPYTQYLHRRADGSTLDLSAFAWSGVLVATPRTWWSIGGQDERFDCWSPEDYAFRFAHETLLGPMPRHEGMAIALDHDADRGGDEQTERTTALYQRYLAARGDRAAMRRLVDEHLGERPQGPPAGELAAVADPGLQAGRP